MSLIGSMFNTIWRFIKMSEQIPLGVYLQNEKVRIAEMKSQQIIKGDPKEVAKILKEIETNVQAIIDGMGKDLVAEKLAGRPFYSYELAKASFRIISYTELIRIPAIRKLVNHIEAEHLAVQFSDERLDYGCIRPVEWRWRCIIFW
jgi:hypothetical protein